MKTTQPLSAEEQRRKLLQQYTSRLRQDNDFLLRVLGSAFSREAEVPLLGRLTAHAGSAMALSALLEALLKTGLVELCRPDGPATANPDLVRHRLTAHGAAEIARVRAVRESRRQRKLQRRAARSEPDGQSAAEAGTAKH